MGLGALLFARRRSARLPQKAREEFLSVADRRVARVGTPLNDAEARELLELRLGAARVNAEPDAVAELIRLCARLPLALAIAAARISAQPWFGLGELAEELAEARRRLGALDAGDEPGSVRAVFSWSVGGLSASAASMFRLLALHPAPDITLPVAASLAGVPLPRARGALRELVSASLVGEHSPGRFTVHDLLRVYAAERGLAQDSAWERQDAFRRVLDYYLHMVHAADAFLFPGRPRSSLPALPPDVVPAELYDARHAESWLVAEQDSLTAAIDKAMELGFYSHAWQIALCLSMFLHVRGRFDERASALRSALRAAEKLTDASAQARVHLAYCVTYKHEGQHHAAFAHAQYAMVLYRSAGRSTGQAIALDVMGLSYAHLGYPRRALACGRLALGLHRARGNLPGEAGAWDTMGYASYLLGDQARAADYYQTALIFYRERAMSVQEACTRVRLGDARLADGSPAEAYAEWIRARTILKQAHHSSAERLNPRLRHVEALLARGSGETADPVVEAVTFEPFDLGLFRSAALRRIYPLCERSSCRTARNIGGKIVDIYPRILGVNVHNNGMGGSGF